MRGAVAGSCLALALTACAVEMRDIGREPHLTPVGSGVNAERTYVPGESPSRPRYRAGNSLWHDSSADLFRDTRAMKVGDVVTVKIAIKDKASLDNTSNRSNDAKRTLGFDFKTAAGGTSPLTKADATLDGAIDSKSSSKGEGAITRSESIELLVAAVVTGVLPNGNLMISGSQEVRVNFEVRVLTVAGLVRPRDITTDNMISYDRIAEARISYGGRGRITEVQQPPIGHQIFDLISPF